MSLGTYTNVCRTCLQENANMMSMFSIKDFMEEEQSIQLCDILMFCASIQIFQGDGLPDKVCINCTEEMNRAFLFRKLCEKSDATLRNCIQTLLPIQNDNINSQDIELKSNEIELGLKNNVLDSNINECYSKLDDDGVYSEALERSDESDDNIYEQKRKVRKLRNTFPPKRKGYPCKECETLCLGLGDYRRHMCSAHGKIYKCDNCGKEFRTETILSRHKRSHSENCRSTQRKSKPYRNKTGIIKKRNLPRTCNICNKTFRFHSNLERHKLIHTGEKPYLCNVCGKGFAQLSYLKIHSFIHTGEKPYKCQMCEKSFAAPGTLMTHIRTHTGERPHVCKICGKDFPQSGYLSAHIRTHTGEKPVECQVCHRRFNQSGRLIIHMRIHSGEKPYNCVECGRSFAVKGTLKKHIRTHTGERPYICSVCGQAFAQSGTLATHMKVHKAK